MSLASTFLGSTGGAWTSQEFTSSGTWTRPAGVDVVFIEMCGGGGGAERSTSANGAVGGGGAEVVERLVPVSGDVTVTIGAGGLGKTGTAGLGTAGGDTSFGIVVARGAPGTAAVPSGGTRIGVPGGAYGGSLTYFQNTSPSGCPGGYGGPGAAPGGGVPGYSAPGSGNASGGGSLGPGGNGGTTPTDAAANTGGGGGASTNANADGKNGGSGKCTVYWQE